MHIILLSKTSSCKKINIVRTSLKKSRSAKKHSKCDTSLNSYLPLWNNNYIFIIYEKHYHFVWAANVIEVDHHNDERSRICFTTKLVFFKEVEVWRTF